MKNVIKPAQITAAIVMCLMLLGAVICIKTQFSQEIQLPLDVAMVEIKPGETKTLNSKDGSTWVVSRKDKPNLVCFTKK